MSEMFKLFSLEDKELRGLLHGRLLSEISSRTTSGSNNGPKKRKVQSATQTDHIPPSEMKKRVQEFLMKYINSSKTTDELVLRAVASLVCALYKRRDWADDFTVNSMLTELCKASDSKVSSAAMYIFLGESSFAAAMLDMGSSEPSSKNKGGKKNKDENENESDIEEDGSKRKKKKSNDDQTDFGAIDSIVEPYSFTEELLKRAMGSGGGSGGVNTSFEYRLLALRVVCRMVYRRELVLPNLYPFIEKYLYPSNRHVTKVLACLAQACHANVPPEEMQSVVRHVLNNFVSDHCRPEVITVGLNALRGICERAPLALNKDQLMDIVQYRNMKTSKSVSGAARALLNLFREIHPELLHKSLRGKEAAIAVQKGTTDKIAQFGEVRVSNDIDGLELLSAAAKKRKRVTEEDTDEVYEDDGDEYELDEDEDDKGEYDEGEYDEDDEEEDEDEDDVDEDDVDEDDVDEDDDEVGDEDDDEDDEEVDESEEPRTKISMAAERILTNEDFKRIRKLKSIVADKGSIDSDDLGGDSSEDDLDDAVVHDEEQDWILNPELMGSLRKDGGKKKDGNATNERKYNMYMKSETRRGGLTNKEKKRMKPLMMSVKKESTRKRGMSAAQKFKELKGHISNLRKQVGPQKRRRSGKFNRR